MPNQSIRSESGVQALVQRAQRRSVWTATAEQAALVTVLLLGTLTVLLLVGSQIMNGYLLASIAIGCLIFGYWRVRRSVERPYQLAQLLDRRFRTNDTISTAWFLLKKEESSPRRDNPQAVRLALEQAEQLAPTLDPATIFPMTGHRFWMIAGALGIVSCSLFALRYLGQAEIDLKRPLIPTAVIREWNKVVEAVKPKPTELQASAEDRLLSPIPQSPDAKPRETKPPPPQLNQDVIGVKTSDADTSESQPNVGKDAAFSAGKQNDISGGEHGLENKSEKSAGASAAKNSGNTPDGQQQAPSRGENSQTPGSKKQQASSEQKSNGLIDRMKDAVSNMFAQAQPSESSAQSAQASAKSQGDQDQDSMQGSSGEPNGQKASDDARETGQQNSGAQGKEHGEGSEQAKATQGSHPERGSGKNSGDSQSSIGKQEGSKAVREAEQQKAMGKLAEIIGKRSESVSGESRVETSSNNHQLSTQYTDQKGVHADRGGEINRDQVPLMYRSYIREYMMQVRKQAQ